jgi:hypothetical protein
MQHRGQWVIYHSAKEFLKKKYEHGLNNFAGAQHLENRPVKTVLIDHSVNEVFLFHGTRENFFGTFVVFSAIVL